MTAATRSAGVAGHPESGTSLHELAVLFLKLGATAFGGPAVHIAMMEEEVVRRRAWLTREQFLDFLGATNLIPGPNSTEMAIHVGHARRGWAGLVVAGTCFILPAVLIVTALAWAYVRFGSLPQVGRLLYGIKPVVIAVVAQALWLLGRSALKNWWLAAVGIACTLGALFGMNELVLLAVAGAACGLALFRAAPRAAGASLLFGAAGVQASAAGAAVFGLWPLFLIFLKIGSVLFGSGYVLLVFLRADLVQRLGWLTERQLLDAVAVGQVTPGPVFTTATFVGYVLGGGAGAAIATLGIFLPAFVFVAVSGPLVPRLRRSPVAGAVLDGVNAASLALMTVVTWRLGLAAIGDTLTAVIALLSLAVLLRWRINSAWLIAAGGLAGLLLGP